MPIGPLSVSDLQTHVVKFGLDVYPVPDIPNERTHLNMFYEAARDRWPQLFDRISAGDAEFKIMKSIKGRAGLATPTATVETFVLTNRGPVFAFPLRLPDPFGETGLEAEHIDTFKSVLELLLKSVPSMKMLKVGYVREAVFSVGNSPATDLLTDQGEFAGAPLAGANSIRLYQDDKMNIRISLGTVEIMKTDQLPVGTRFEQRIGFGLQVIVDVNNKEIKPLEQADIDEVIERATSIWPNDLLQFLNQGSES